MSLVGYPTGESLKTVTPEYRPSPASGMVEGARYTWQLTVLEIMLEVEAVYEFALYVFDGPKPNLAVLVSLLRNVSKYAITRTTFKVKKNRTSKVQIVRARFLANIRHMILAAELER
jgi:hypothetical protein